MFCSHPVISQMSLVTLVNRALYKKYTTTFLERYYIREINDLLEPPKDKPKHRAAHKLKDFVDYHNPRTFLTAMYEGKSQGRSNLRDLSRYYKFHKDIPRLFLAKQPGPLITVYYKARRKADFKVVSEQIRQELIRENKLEQLEVLPLYKREKSDEIVEAPSNCIPGTKILHDLRQSHADAKKSFEEEISNSHIKDGSFHSISTIPLKQTLPTEVANLQNSFSTGQYFEHPDGTTSAGRRPKISILHAPQTTKEGSDTQSSPFNYTNVGNGGHSNPTKALFDRGLLQRIENKLIQKGIMHGGASTTRSSRKFFFLSGDSKGKVDKLIQLQRIYKGNNPVSALASHSNHMKDGSGGYGAGNSAIPKHGKRESTSMTHGTTTNNGINNSSGQNFNSIPVGNNGVLTTTAGTGTIPVAGPTGGHNGMILGLSPQSGNNNISGGPVGNAGTHQSIMKFKVKIAQNLKKSLSQPSKQSKPSAIHLNDQNSPSGRGQQNQSIKTPNYIKSSRLSSTGLMLPPSTRAAEPGKKPNGLTSSTSNIKIFFHKMHGGASSTSNILSGNRYQHGTVSVEREERDGSRSKERPYQLQLRQTMQLKLDPGILREHSSSKETIIPLPERKLKQHNRYKSTIVLTKRRDGPMPSGNRRSIGGQHTPHLKINSLLY